MRLHAIVDDLDTARIAAEGGATVIQLRLKEAPTDEVVARGRPFKELCDETGLTFIVNDDVDAAIELRADGVHLGRDDEGVELAIETLLLLGRSASSPAEAVAVAKEGASYIGAGPIWATPSKEDADPPIGLEGLRAIAAAVSIPVVAIGGVDASNAHACIEAGATGVAVIRAARDAVRLSAAL
jgi:thiamine-phosphate pyrophosphorylase